MKIKVYNVTIMIQFCVSNQEAHLQTNSVVYVQIDCHLPSRTSHL